MRFMSRRSFPLATRAVLAAAVCTTGCGPSAPTADPDAAPPPDATTPPDAALPPDAAPTLGDADPMPELLSESGLYTDIAADEINPAVQAYEPQFPLWSDGATKRRWIYLPPGTVIDTSDGDFWRYPEGTRLWKEFTRDGVRVETRLLAKNGPSKGDWFMMTYVWNEAGTEAEAERYGVDNALGTDHDVPSQSECEKCHAPMPDIALGFSAIQLDHAAGGVTLQTLIDQGRLSDPPGTGGVPYYPLPGNADEQAVLGYLHGNCGGCHHEESPVQANAPRRPILRLGVASGVRNTVEETLAYVTTVGSEPVESTDPPTTSMIEPGDKDASAVYVRMTSRTASGAPAMQQMPPVGSDLVHTDMAELIGTWIDGL